MSFSESFMDHLVSCISKSLKTQVKSRTGGVGSVAAFTSMATALQTPIPGQAQVPWFLHGTMSRSHAALIIQLLVDIMAVCLLYSCSIIYNMYIYVIFINL